MRTKIIKLIANVIDINKLVKLIRRILHPGRICCTKCSCDQVRLLGNENKYPRKYICSKCANKFTEWDNTILENSKLPLEIIFLFIILMNFGLPISCIAFCLSISYKTTYRWYWRVLKNLQKLDDKPVLADIVESDEAYVTSGKKGEIFDDRESRVRGLKSRGRGTMAKDRPPILGLVDRLSKKIRLFVCEDVKKKTVEKLIKSCVEKGCEIHTDGYDIYNGLHLLGYTHKLVIHSQGLYAEDQDGDGICEVHCNSVEGLWSMFKQFLRGFRGVNKRKLAGYVRLFEYLYNARVENRVPEQMMREMLIISAF